MEEVKDRGFGFCKRFEDDDPHPDGHSIKYEHWGYFHCWRCGWSTTEYLYPVYLSQIFL